MNDRAMRMLLPALLSILALAGCVERRFLIRSEPPGAVVSLNRGEPLSAAAPTEVEFHHYGTWAVRAELPGYRDLVADVPVPAPWWSWPPFDFFTDLLWPFTIRDHREIRLVLTPLPPERPLPEARERHAGVIERGEALREAVNGGDPAGVR